MTVSTRFATVEEAIEEIREGRMVVVVDDEDRENEGDLTIGAQFATPDAINFMATHARGLICLCLTEERADELALRPMTDHNETPLGTAFTVSVEAREGVTTGISAADRSRTIQVAIHPDSTPHDLVQPGDVIHSLRCECGEQVEQGLAQIEAEGTGVLLYMAQEGRGIGLINKLRAYELQEQGMDTVEANLELGFPADARDYGIGNQILSDLGLTTIRIITNNPKKLVGIDGFGLTVVEQVPIEVSPQAENLRYLATKRAKLGHRLHHQDLKNLDYEPENE